jgi:hypothetical protein
VIFKQPDVAAWLEVTFLHFDKSSNL